jgi:hypothetical protein
MTKPTEGTRPRVQLSYQIIRNTTSPDETATGVRSFVCNLPAFEILKLGTNANLRTYLAEYSESKRNHVHEAIAYTIENDPARFITRNSGFAIAASEAQIDDNKKTILLYDASVINGAQSQGEIRRWVKEEYGEEGPDTDEDIPFYVRAEIIVDPDSKQIVETAIARNTATPVKSISQAGGRGHLEDLEQSIVKIHPDIRIKKKETDGEGYYDTRKILQYTRLLMPQNVSENDSASEKLKPYKNPEQCLTEFSEWYGDREKKPSAKFKYEFTVQMAPYAITEYEYWEHHQAWNRQRLWESTKKGGRACRRDKGNNRITWVSPGLIFPILGAMSEFVEQDTKGNWRISKPNLFRPDEMIARAVKQFRSTEVKSDPMLMGRSSGVYEALRDYPATLVAVIREMKES